MIKGLNLAQREGNARGDSPTFLFPALLLQKFQDRIKKLEAVLLEQDKVRGVGNEHALLDGRVNKVAHQSFAILGVGPCVVLAGDHERRRIDIGGVP
jgi:hypothetical protein